MVSIYEKNGSGRISGKFQVPSNTQDLNCMFSSLPWKPGKRTESTNTQKVKSPGE